MEKDALFTVMYAYPSAATALVTDDMGKYHYMECPETKKIIAGFWQF
jgi:hypothetical protein